MNYYKHHIGDYLKDTAHLTMVEDGAYRRLLDIYYTQEAPIPPERKSAYRLARARTKDEQEAVDTILQEYFTEQANGWHHNRCDREIEAAALRTAHNREVGKKGGRPQMFSKDVPRRTKANGLSEETHRVMEENPEITHRVSEKLNGHNPNNNPQKTLSTTPLPTTPITREEKSSVRPTATRFDEFWKAYPRKTNRKKALDAWRIKKLDSHPETIAKILDDLSDRPAKDEQWNRGVIPHGSTYLNGNRWEDAW